MSKYISQETPDAINLVLAERRDQVLKGYDPDHDDQHTSEELELAAVTYLCSQEYRKKLNRELLFTSNTPYTWPWKDSEWKPEEKDRLKELVKGGALALAAIERFLRNRPEQPDKENVRDLLIKRLAIGFKPDSSPEDPEKVIIPTIVFDSSHLTHDLDYKVWAFKVGWWHWSVHLYFTILPKPKN